MLLMATTLDSLLPICPIQTNTPSPAATGVLSLTPRLTLPEKPYYKIAGIVENHNYDGAPKHGEVKGPELKVVEPFIIPKYPRENTENDG